jgi:hypothetical protein
VNPVDDREYFPDNPEQEGASLTRINKNKPLTTGCIFAKKGAVLVRRNE